MKYCEIRHKLQSNCKIKLEKCIIYSQVHLANKHQFGVDGCKIEVRENYASMLEPNEPTVKATPKQILLDTQIDKKPKYKFDKK